MARFQWLNRLALPLLAKELTEQAARRRTYVMRVVYACLLFAAAYLLFFEILRISSASPLAALGRGREMFEWLMKLQFAGIYLFMPAITCGVLAHEKEQRTLGLLFLTRLGPWTILFEKLSSRLVPMCCFLLLSLPLVAHAYSVGGITRAHLLFGVWMLLITVLQVGALALACSAWFRTTLGALVGTYAAGALLVFGPVLVMLALSPFFEGARLRNWEYGRFVTHLWDKGVIRSSDAAVYPFFAPVHFFEYGVYFARGPLKFIVGAAPSPASVVIGSSPILFSAALFLVLSRVFLFRRAAVPPGNRLLDAFKKLDGIFAQWNARFAGGRVLIRDSGSFPDARPIAWRETTKRSLGRARYLIRLLIAIEATLFTLVIFVVIFTDGDSIGAQRLLTFLLWGLVLLIVSMRSASLFGGERSHQTLETLCATPLGGRDIVLQKFCGVRRVMFVLSIPLLTLIVPAARGPESLLGSLLSVAVYLPLAAWLSLWVGLKVKAPGRAILIALAAILAWCVIPFVFVFLPLLMLGAVSPQGSLFNYSIFLSPAMFVAVNEYGDFREFGGTPWPGMIFNFLLYGSIVLLLRRNCLRHADRLLGRLAGS